MFAVDDGVWPVLLTSVDAGSGSGSTIGPKGRLVLASEKLSASVNETLTLISLPTSALTSLVTGGVGAHVPLGVAVDPDPLVGPVEGGVTRDDGNREPVPVVDVLSVGEQDAGALRGSQDYRAAGGGLVRLGVHDQ